MKKIIILACSCFLLAACGNSAKTNKSTSADSTATQTVDIHNAETSLDYEGERIKESSLPPTARASKQL